MAIDTNNIDQVSITAGGTYTLDFDAWVLIGANGGVVTVGITIDGTVFDYPNTIADTKVDDFPHWFPKGTVFTIKTANAKLMAWPAHH